MIKSVLYYKIYIYIEQIAIAETHIYHIKTPWLDGNVGLSSHHFDTCLKNHKKHLKLIKPNSALRLASRSIAG